MAPLMAGAKALTLTLADAGMATAATWAAIEAAAAKAAAGSCFSKGGNQNQRDSEFANLDNVALIALYNSIMGNGGEGGGRGDNKGPQIGKLIKRIIKELKARKLRNARKDRTGGNVR